MKYRFYTCDVFTDVRFGGNPLAVLPDAKGLSSEQMQAIAREFNYSESTFVLPSEQGYTRKIRIFTPTQEVPFAGHPNIGTAFTLASIGEFGDFTDQKNVVFEENAGPVPITINKTALGIRCELKAPEPLTIGAIVPADLMAAALSLSVDDIVIHTHQPQLASVGLPFIMAELKNQAALEQACTFIPAIHEIHARGLMPDILAYVRSEDEFDIRARVFAPLDGVPEDPATGSANCALVAMLSYYTPEVEGAFSWCIAQGVEMGRPSILNARTHKHSTGDIGVWIAGDCVSVSEGFIEV